MSFRTHVPRLFAGMLAALLAASCSDPVSRLAAPRSLRADADAAANRAPASQHIFMMNGAIPANFASQVAARGGAVVRAHGEIGVVVTRGLSDADALALAGSSGDVVRDTVMRWVPSLASARGSIMTLPNAPPASVTSINPPQAAAFLAFQWNMFQIHAPDAWNTRTGNPGVRVAILDTGLDPDHLDQRGLIDLGTSVAFVPSLSGPPDWADDNLHGTFVGGIVTSNDFGTAGVAPNVTLVAVKVLDATGSGSFGDIIAGIVYAANAHVQVINMSLGAVIPKNAPGVSKLTSALNRAINYAHRNDVLVVAAAGNDDLDLQHDGNLIEVPCETGVDMCVSATGRTDTKASYSNYGTNAINVAAPGGDIDGPP
ncbi:MAG TPA: S8 family serine peptidase, partial [Gemmatimonadaceae bacterium]